MSIEWHEFGKDGLPEENKNIECTMKTGKIVEVVRNDELYLGVHYLKFTYYKDDFVMWRYIQNCPCGRKY